MAFKEKRERRPRRSISKRLSGKGLQRIVVLAVVFGIGTFVVLFGKLWQLQVVQHETLEKKAITQQTREVSSTAHRGAIYDASGATLAISASVQNVILSPRDVIKTVEVKEKDEYGNQRSQTAIDAEREQKVEERYNVIADGMSQILKIDRAEIMERLHKTNSAWEKLASKVEDDIADQVRQFIDENDLEGCLYLTDDSKRYYPYGSLASHVIGFVNSEGVGAYGLEAVMNSELAGEDGRIVMSKNASGTEMLSPYSSYVDATDGYDVHTTIDATIQMYAEKTLQEGVEKFDVINGAFCVVMDPDTGAILAMASTPGYDPNNPSVITDPLALSDLEKLKDDPAVSEEDYEKAENEARLKQWESKLLNTSYEPGSTFKPIVMASALEENVVNPATDSFYCSGVVHVGDHDIRCSARSGHGSQSLERVLVNSCNPGMIEIGNRLGAETFYQYWEDFGFTETTGIELPGEYNSYFWPKSEFISPSGVTSLATASFGQRFQATPLQIVRALSAVVNGGHLMQPYLVQSVTDSDGNVVSYHEPHEIRQVISQETSDLMRTYMESVVSSRNGTGKNAYVEGYKIGGKTGSSQTLTSPDRIIVSFAGIAPADDPEVVVLLGYDWPKPAQPGANTTADGIYISGGSMAAPMAGELIANILDYMGYKKSDTATANTGVTIPDLRGSSLESAQAALAKLGLNCRTSGDGTVVTDQIPAAGSSIPAGSSVVLYMGTQKSGETVTMPDLTGMTYDEAKAKLEGLELYLNATGSGKDGKVFEQVIAPGTPLEVGTSVEVKFTDDSVQDW
ncbi:MAG: penicillin-binding transpeptidase domain-containing protein [Evtepia sp.]|uniref:penicillin-binding transpeptidase domain-containing protein n=1 Tax=Evtepia sp. TaxID=2773933 RepID=UPI002A7647F2|nr:penicillin-binding transpeptidase domain-containing protein [Evtepia sp.]MDY3013728.1 penicillin-binding transpeptidase domain-containing protein [Evtepia sp.]